ncbi:hypothetical protein [Paludisphaera borealis]|uniref:Uncharacterized protein n=1 Tax=Paludisphaera borealis TaxID=1387353 RepID=A0A1U7CX41_9BACT|nr:hypothetical protein [Paludisphaera borealis]APW63522.1 hypothetical protein BSF38_05094 [Paludisphaera borealis]
MIERGIMHGVKDWAAETFPAYKAILNGHGQQPRLTLQNRARWNDAVTLYFEQEGITFLAETIKNKRLAMLVSNYSKMLSKSASQGTTHEIEFQVQYADIGFLEQLETYLKAKLGA